MNNFSRYRLTWSTVCISLCSLVAYPVSITAETVTNLQCWDHDLYVCDRLFIYKIKFSTFLLQVLALGVNFLFYTAFASRFRQLLARRMRSCWCWYCRCCCCCCCCRRDDGVLSDPGDTLVHVVGGSSKETSFD